MMKTFHKLKSKPLFIRLYHWEYWPGQWLYLPLGLYFLYLALRYRHPCFFTAANPGLYTGGLGMESKYKTLQLIPEAFRPRSVFVPKGQRWPDTLQALRLEGISFPLIAKPDVGYRGLLVKKIDSEAALQIYLATYPIDFIIQEFIDLPEEVGVLYHRHPNEQKGQITSLTQKEFLSVTGDGRSSIRDLILEKPRALLQLERLEKEDAGLLEKVAAAGEKIALGIIGNHAKGTAFLNANHLIGECLREAFDHLSLQIPAFYYGRYDVKCQSLDELMAGKRFKIIELNGVCSEPAHIYDAGKTSYWQALRTVARHWGIIGALAAANHRLGVPYMKPAEMIRAIRQLLSYNRAIRRHHDAHLETSPAASRTLAEVFPSI